MNEEMVAKAAERVLRQRPKPPQCDFNATSKPPQSLGTEIACGPGTLARMRIAAVAESMTGCECGVF
jgi:hypothetical protein